MLMIIYQTKEKNLKYINQLGQPLKTMAPDVPLQYDGNGDPTSIERINAKTTARDYEFDLWCKL